MIKEVWLSAAVWGIEQEQTRGASPKWPESFMGLLLAKLPSGFIRDTRFKSITDPAHLPARSITASPQVWTHDSLV